MFWTVLIVGLLVRSGSLVLGLFLYHYWKDLDASLRNDSGSDGFFDWYAQEFGLISCHLGQILVLFDSWFVLL